MGSTGNIINLAQRSGQSQKAPSADMMQTIFEGLNSKLNEMVQLMNILFLNDRVLKRALVDKKFVTEELLEKIFQQEVDLSNQAVEILQAKDTSEEKLSKAKEKGIPFDLLNPIGLVSFDRRLSYQEKVDLANKFGLEDLKKFLEVNKTDIISMSNLAI